MNPSDNTDLASGTVVQATPIGQPIQLPATSGGQPLQLIALNLPDGNIQQFQVQLPPTSWCIPLVLYVSNWLFSRQLEGTESFVFKIIRPESLRFDARRLYCSTVTLLTSLVKPCCCDQQWSVISIKKDCIIFTGNAYSWLNITLCFAGRHEPLCYACHKLGKFFCEIPTRGITIIPSLVPVLSEALLYSQLTMAFYAKTYFNF